MSFIDELAAKRQKLLEGIDANEGDINLSIFEDFYPDEAHFIYELLQNAEDAGATEATFELIPQSCAFIHNGPRHFNEQDIKAITGIFNSSKKDAPDKIGKFGVGFKSVFVYTDTPIVYSKNYSFQISQLVLPTSIPQKEGLGQRTRFEFPFNNSKKDAIQAFAEVKAGLEELSETTLLFLNNLKCINWKIGNAQGAVFREEHSAVHIEVLKEAGNNKVLSSHWLRFNAAVEDLERFTSPVDGLTRQKVAVAYELAFLPDMKTFEPKIPLSKQLKIVPAEQGRVSVFFPADKETSGLRFHLHAPFIPELSRASIKNSPENLPLFDQLGKLAAHSLHGIKELGLLTGGFLAVLPNNDDALPERYRVIRDAVMVEMRAQSLTPTYGEGHSPAKNLLQASVAMKALLTEDDLEILLVRNDKPMWSIGAVRGSNQEKFLTSLGIESWDEDSLIELLGERASKSIIRWDSSLDPKVMTWLASKTDEWHQQLYAILYRFLEKDDGFRDLSEVNFIRLGNGKYSTGEKAYFPSEHSNSSDPFPRVAETIFTAGTRKAQQSDARKFLEKIGVREVGESEEIDLILEQRYGKESKPPTDKVYLADLNRFMSYAEKVKSSTIQFKFSRAAIFKVESTVPTWKPAAAVYLDEPFKKTGLRHYHGALSAIECKKWPLNKWYKDCGIEASMLVSFAELVGCSTIFSECVVESYCSQNPRWSYLRQVAGERRGNSISQDFSISELVKALLLAENVELSRLVWRRICSLKSTYLQAKYQRTQKGGARYADSSLICFLRAAKWVPLKDGRFVAPIDANRQDLLNGFTFDTAYEWLNLVNFGENETKKSEEYAARARKRDELGFETDAELERAQAFTKIPQEEQERFLEKYRAQTDEPFEEFPTRPVRNKDIRKQRVQEQANQTPEKETQIRQRSEAVGYEAAKAEAKQYLREQYTENGVMFCQVCKSALPFRLPSGVHYFEAVEVVTGMSKRFRESFLALCPNHAAMFQHANDDKDNMQGILGGADSMEVSVVMGGEPSTIHFTEMHLSDIQDCLKSFDMSAVDVERGA